MKKAEAEPVTKEEKLKKKLEMEALSKMDPKDRAHLEEVKSLKATIV